MFCPGSSTWGQGWAVMSPASHYLANSSFPGKNEVTRRTKWCSVILTDNRNFDWLTLSVNLFLKKNWTLVPSTDSVPGGLLLRVGYCDCPLNMYTVYFHVHRSDCRNTHSWGRKLCWCLSALHGKNWSVWFPLTVTDGCEWERRALQHCKCVMMNESSFSTVYAAFCTSKK